MTAPAAPYSAVTRARLVAAHNAGDVDALFELGNAAVDAYDEAYELMNWSALTPHVEGDAEPNITVTTMPAFVGYVSPEDVATGRALAAYTWEAFNDACAADDDADDEAAAAKARFLAAVERGDPPVFIGYGKTVPDHSLCGPGCARYADDGSAAVAAVSAVTEYRWQNCLDCGDPVWRGGESPRHAACQPDRKAFLARLRDAARNPKRDWEDDEPEVVGGESE